MHTAESNWNPDEIVDTKRLQIFSLCQMMKGLHYEFVEYSSAPSRFESKHYSNIGREVLSVSSCIKLYNGNSAKCVFGRPPEKLNLWCFSDYAIAQAKAARITKQVKLQWCCQTNNFIVQDHRIQFVMSSYKALFLSNKYLG